MDMGWFRTPSLSLRVRALVDVDGLPRVRQRKESFSPSSSWMPNRNESSGDGWGNGKWLMVNGNE